MGWSGIDGAETAGVGRIARKHNLQLVPTLVVEVDRARAAVNFKREEIVPAICVAGFLDRADRTGLETQKRDHLVVDVDFPTWTRRLLVRGAELVEAARLQWARRDVSLDQCVDRRDLADQIASRVDHMSTDVADRPGAGD